MSDKVHPTRVVWDGHRGVVRHEGHEKVLRGPPPALPDLVEVDYDPASGTAQVRRHPYDKMDDMQPIEVEAIVEWLRGWVRWNDRFFMMRPKGTPR